ncbi:MAG: nitroreductase family protein [Infirmifilum sp.]
MLFELLLTRRSIRNFQEKDVPEELIVKAIDIARHAPSARNTQPWRVLIIRSRDLLDKLSRVAPGARPLLRAPLGIGVVVMPEESPLTFMIDGSIFTTYLWLALTSLGLGAVWINTLRWPQYAEILGIPEDEVLLAILAAGFPAESPAPRPRKKLEDLLTWL